MMINNDNNTPNNNSFAGDNNNENKTKKQTKKRKYNPRANENTRSIISWLESYEEKCREREESNMRRIEAMHAQKMTLFEKLIDKL